MAQTTTQSSGPALLEGRAKNLALAGLFLANFVSMLAMNVVGTSMPIIIADIGGTQAAFTWVVTATMLASAISTPIWGKLADLTSKKALLQISLTVFIIASAMAGFAQDPSWLITCRVFQGIGVGGLGALAQIVLAEIISPLERGKYMGILGAVMAVATVGGPLLGGLFTDTIGWRWNFYVAAPIAIIAIIMLQRTLHLPVRKQKIKIDYWGTALISLGFSSLLIWVTLAGSNFAWWSWQTVAMVGGGVAALVIAVFVEMKVEEPLIPMTLFKNRTFTMASIASIAVGLAMMGTMVFLGQYMQLARGRSVIESSLLSLPMMGGVLLSSAIVGQIITRTGKWKRYVVAGAIALLAGLVMMGQLRYDTNYWFVGVSMAVVGAGVGMTMQNLVLVVQNTVAPTQLGASSAAVTFFRTIGGTAGISVMGTILAHEVADYFKEGFTKLAATLQQNPDPAVIADLQRMQQSSAIPKIADLTAPVREVVEASYGHAIGNIFLAAAPVALVALIAIIFLPNIPLSNKSNAERIAELQNGEDGEPGVTLPSTPRVLVDATGPILLPVQHREQSEGGPSDDHRGPSGATPPKPPRQAQRRPARARPGQRATHARVTDMEEQDPRPAGSAASSDGSTGAGGLSGSATSSGSSAERDATVSDIIAEFSQVFAFARTRWSRYAEEVHPELKGVGMMVLQVILRKGPITATALSQMLDMDKAVVSRQVSKLRQLELIEAKASDEDRRVTLLRSSESAQHTIDRLHAENADAYSERFAEWSVDELETLRAGLHRFNQSSPEPADTPSQRCTRTHERSE
ncbi:DHA2 family efflux MFS transporter permease subunit [Leucobacter sp. GX24907]